MKAAPLLLVYFALLAGSAFPEAAPAPRAAAGYQCLFMGHSFFHPVALGFDEHAHRAGLTAHRQLCTMSGGATGTPGFFWNNFPKERKAPMVDLLKSGSVDIVGFTYHPDGQCGVDDYARWAELALEHNPDTVFFIGLSWSRQPDQPLADFEASNKIARDILCKKIDALRDRFPGKSFFLINYGKAVVELKRLYEDGQFPEIESLVKEPGKKGTHLFGDPLGHAGPLVISMSQLVWLAAIYQSDLTTYDWNPHPEVDFKTIAARVVAEEPYSKFTPPNP